MRPFPLAWLAPLLAAGLSFSAAAQTLPIARASRADGALSAAPSSCGSTQAFVACRAVSANRLRSMRGGYDAGNGLQASFGITRMAYVNGQLVAESSLHIPDLGRAGGASATGLGAWSDTRSVVQLGAGNGVRIEQLPAGATVIQNTLNNQSIRTLTVVDAASNGLQLLRGAHSQMTLRDALTAPLTPR